MTTYLSIDTPDIHASIEVAHGGDDIYLTTGSANPMVKEDLIQYLAKALEAYKAPETTICCQCGSSMVAPRGRKPRYDKRYCSTTCRTAAFRAKRATQ